MEIEIPDRPRVGYDDLIEKLKAAIEKTDVRERPVGPISPHQKRRLEELAHVVTAYIDMRVLAILELMNEQTQSHLAAGED